MNVPGLVVLDETAGSQAYGLATPESDTDHLGVFIAPTSEYVGLDWNRHRQTVVGKNDQGDFAYHEFGKAIGLWLSCNPTLTELLWLDGVNRTDWIHPDAIPPSNPLGLGHWTRGQLHHLRPKFLSTSAVVNAYGGYAKQQMMKLAKRDDGSFSSDTRNRTAKHARHCMRLMIQGFNLLSMGILQVRVSEGTRDYLFEMGELATKNVDAFIKRWEREDALFKTAESVLPAKPDREAVNRFLVAVRRACWDLPEVTA